MPKDGTPPPKSGSRGNPEVGLRGEQRTNDTEVWLWRGAAQCALAPKPRGGPRALGGEYQTRLSFCCAAYRRRSTSASVRFLGRRFYLAAVVGVGLGAARGG